MTNFSGKNLNAACGGPQGGGMDSRRNGVAEVSPKYLAEAASNADLIGYKQTEAGDIPLDWECHNFGDLVDYKKGYAFKSEQYGETGTRIIRVSDTSYADIKDETPIFISDKLATLYQAWSLREGDLIFSTVGSKPPMYDSLVGKAIYVTKKHEGSLLNQNAVRIRAKSKTEGIQALLLNHFRTERYIDFIEVIYRGNANQASITLENLFEFKIPLPSVEKEQTAIANALSDVDALISELEKLIAKKQAIKTATMQQLLTGRTRLPQFALREDGTPKGTKPSELGEIPEDWEVVEFSSIVWFQEGPGVRQYQFTSAGIKLLNGTNIENGSLLLEKTQRFISEKLAYGQYSHFMIDAGDILIACSGVTIERFDEKVTVVSNEDLPLCLNTSTMRFKVRSENTDKIFIKNFLKSSFFKDQIGGKATGSAQLNFGPYHVNQVKIAVPNKEEQTSIATILSDMDTEIQALEQRLGKTRQIKQGMMQELLTGKTRLMQPQNKECQHG